MDLLLDTGFDGELEINAAFLDRYDLETRPDHRLVTPEEILENPAMWDPEKPYKGTVVWEGREREAGIRPKERRRHCC